MKLTDSLAVIEWLKSHASEAAMLSYADAAERCTADTGIKLVGSAIRRIDKEGGTHVIGTKRRQPYIPGRNERDRSGDFAFMARCLREMHGTVKQIAEGLGITPPLTDDDVKGLTHLVSRRRLQEDTK